ncbi:MAG: HlyD family efflux transporter periplasmic adaptor subunit, partial [Bacteroidota bacterium]
AENKPVEKGDLLVVLNSDKLDQQILFQQEKINQNTAFIKDLNDLLLDSIPPDRLETPLFQISYFQYQKQLAEYQLKIDQAQRVLNRNQALYDSGVIARADYEEFLFQRDVQLKMLEAFTKQQKKSWEIELLQYQNQIQESQATIRQLQQEKQQYTIKAPISGTVTQFAGLQAGNFISPGQNLAQIAATDSLIVECYVSPGDIGFLYEEMPVNFQIDAFNYNQWGLAQGRIAMISKDVVMMEEQPSFLVRCHLDTQALQLKNGYPGKLKKGMTLTARFQLSQRSLYQLLYDKIDDWLNPNLATS